MAILRMDERKKRDEGGDSELNLYGVNVIIKY